MYKVNGKDIREIVAREDWQTLRKSLLGTWKRDPEGNVKKLREWLLNDYEEEKRVIVYNYLTGSGFRMKVISHPEIDRLREEVKKEAAK
jgi:hypothetical protein